MIKAIIFDAYGTLISTGTGSVDATREILTRLNISIDPNHFYKDWKSIHKKHIESLDAFQTEEEIFVRDLHVLFEKYSINNKPEDVVSIMICSLTGRIAFSDSKEVLNSLSQQYTISIGSTSDTEPLIENIIDNKLDINHVFTSQSLKVYKPKKEFYKKILSALAISSAEAVFVGDSLIDDVMGPQQLGIYSIWLNRNKLDNNTDIIPDAVISTLFDLSEVLKRIK